MAKVRTLWINIALMIKALKSAARTRCDLNTNKDNQKLTELYLKNPENCQFMSYDRRSELIKLKKSF